MRAVASGLSGVISRGWACRWCAGRVGLLAGVELGVDEEAVLEVVDAELDGFGIGDGAEVAGDFDAAPVGFVDRGLELGARDVHVGLEGGDALVGPEGDGACASSASFSWCICMRGRRRLRGRAR